MEIEIINWSKHNPRASIKHPRWFALSNRILEDASLFDLSAEEFRAWIYVLCQASQANSSVISINEKHAERVSGIKLKSLASLLPKLEKAKCIQLRDLAVNTRDLAVITTRQDKTEQTEQNKHNTPKSGDFEKIYILYPKKEGKSKGMEIAERDIKSFDDLRLLCQAVTRYRNHCEENRTEKQFIKHFSTFMSRWRDWLDPDVGTSDLKTASDMPDLSHIKWDDPA